MKSSKIVSLPSARTIRSLKGVCKWYNKEYKTKWFKRDLLTKLKLMKKSFMKTLKKFRLSTSKSKNTQLNYLKTSKIS